METEAEERELFGETPCPWREVPWADIAEWKEPDDMARQAARILRALARAESKGRRLSDAAKGRARIVAGSVRKQSVIKFIDTDGIYDFAEYMAEEYLKLAKENEGLRRRMEGGR